VRHTHWVRGTSRRITIRLSLAVSCCLVLFVAALSAGAETPSSAASLPDAPDAQTQAPPRMPALNPCRVRVNGASLAGQASTSAIQAAGFTPTVTEISPGPGIENILCPVYMPVVNWYARFLNGPMVKPLTPKQKALLAARNIVDPFNALTIAGTSAISVAADSHSPYGPGMPGFARNFGVSFTQDITGEFFNTFLVASLTHEDPHYHREPTASIRHRILHCIVQVVWTQGDNGRGMINYDDLVGFAIDDEVDNLYVPGRATNLPSSASRYAINLALAPTDNAITEFIPDIASKIHVHQVFVQRIIDQVAKTNGGAGGS
jgi:hypothetical protein